MSEQELPEVTDVTTTMTENRRRHRLGNIEIHTTDLEPESVTLKCGNLEIRPLPHTDGSTGPPRYQVLINGKEVASKEVSLHLGVDCLAEARIVWLPDLSEWKG